MKIKSNNTVSFSLRPKRDRDLIRILQEVDEGDGSWFIRELLRDGLKWRAFNTQQTTYNSPAFRESSASIEEDDDYTPPPKPKKKTKAVQVEEVAQEKETLDDQLNDLAGMFLEE